MPRPDIAHPSTAAVAGHPMHPALVPLPIGATALAVATDLAAARTGDAFWARCSRWLLRAALVTGVVAAPSGSIDLLTIPAARRLPSAWVHAAGNGLVMLLTLVEVLRRRGWVRAVEVAPDRTGLALVLLGITGWLGGELSYRHRIGVMRAAAMGETGEEPGSSRHRPVAVPVAGDPDLAGQAWGGGAVEAVDRTAPAGIDDGIMPSEERRERAREAEVPRDGAMPGSMVSAEPAGPGGLVAAAVPGTGAVGGPQAAAGTAALDPDAADAIARELARGEQPAEARADAGDNDRAWAGDPDR